ncbi:MAG: hypothetical protein GX921_02620 [Bacteroidales bacterium]|nr:hypothetical protein [Bacteroidales bacterium]
MRTLRRVVLLMIGVSIFSCQPKFDLKSDKHLAEIFTDTELKEIEKMISYVDDRVMEETGSKDINEAYHQLLDVINQTMQENSKFFVPFEEEEKYAFLESLDSTVFNEFWIMDNHVRMAIYKDSIYEDLDNYKTLDLSRNGKYAGYLKSIGEGDTYYKSVKDNLDAAGGLTPSIVASFLENHNMFDFTIPKHRLWGAVFILIIEEPHDKKMERYLNQKASS